MNQEKSLFELVSDLGNLLAERERLLEESLPPQLRKGYLDPPLVSEVERCEAEMALDSSPTGEDAYQCSRPGRYRETLDVVLCDSCYRAAC